MTYLVFDTYNDAYVANAIISLNMRLNGNITTQWAEIKERLDGKFVIEKPNGYMDYVTGYTEEEYSSEWFAPSEP